MRDQQFTHVAVAVAAALALALAASALTHASVPSSGTLSSTSGPVAWDGPPTGGASPDGEATCVEGTTCDTFALTILPGDYAGMRVRFHVSWASQADDYDVYVHQASNDGPLVGESGNSAPGTVEENTFDLNGVVTAGVNDTYSVHIVAFAAAPLDPFHGVVSLEAIPTTASRVARIIAGAKSGIRFSRSRTVYAFGAGQDVEPNVRVDYQGNAYVGGIRGLLGGNDLWRFDLNPGSPTYDPFLTAATAAFDASGGVRNPAWKGQPDALSPNDPSELGGDGGGDMDLAVGFRPPAPTDVAPLLATSSLVAANVSTQRSTDRGETLTNNPAGNTTGQVDDRQWMEFLGQNAVYLGYRDFTGLQSTSKYYLNRSNDGGLTYGPAVVAAVGGSTTGNIDVDQRDGTVYFCHQGDGTEGNKEVRVAVGHPLSLSVSPVTFTTHVAATGQNQIANLFPVCKVASDGTVYVAYSDGGAGIYIAHSFDQGQTWAPPVRVSDVGPNGVALFPWIETGERPGSLAIVWYGATAADSEDGKGGNTDNANWKVFFAETLNATSSSPTVLQSVASDHFNHGSNISLAGFTTGTSPNRNLADFFQVAIDPQGLAVIAFADDSSDFAGQTFVTHQLAGSSLNNGRAVRVAGSEPVIPVATTAPQVFDFRHDARAVSPPPVMPDVDSPADILTIGYRCQAVNGATWLAATMATSGLNTLPPLGTWRMNFASNPTRPGLVDRADQWFLEADTDAAGAPTYSYGTGTRNSDGSVTYTIKGAADAGSFDLTNRTVTVKVDLARLGALSTRGPVQIGTVLIGLRGTAVAARQVVAGLASTGLSDSTRAGGTFTIGSCQQ